MSRRTGRRRGRSGGKHLKTPGDLRGDEASEQLNGPVTVRRMTPDELAELRGDPPPARPDRPT